MFVVNIKRFNTLVGLTAGWFILFAYLLFGVLFWMAVLALRLIKPIASVLYWQMSENLEEKVRIVWPLELFGFLIVCLVALWYCSIRLLLDYEDRKLLLDGMNRVIDEISSLSVPGGFVSYTFRGGYGSATTEIASLGGHDYKLKSTRRDTAGVPTTETTVFRATSSFFASDKGSSEAVMNTVFGSLLIQKQYGVQSIKAESSL